MSSLCFPRQKKGEKYQRNRSTIHGHYRFERKQFFRHERSRSNSCLYNDDQPNDRATRVAYDSLMYNQEFLQILEDRKVDLVIYNALFNNFSAIIADNLKVPYITHNSASGFPFHLASMGAPKDAHLFQR